MTPLPPLSPAALWLRTVPGVGNNDLGLRPGVILTATLAGRNETTVQLRLADGRLLTAQGRIERPVGASLRLQVAWRDGAWQLRPLAEGGESALLRLLRESLPHRLDMRTLSRLLSDTPATGEGWQRLWATLPTLGQLLPSQGLRAAFLRAGLQLERHLAQGRVDGHDLKAVLLGLLDDDDPRLRKLAEGLLQQLRSRQAEALLEPQQGLLTLPFRVDEQVEVLEFQWRRQTTGEETVFHLRLSLEPARLGPVTVELRWDGRTLDLAFWAERPDTVQCLHQHKTRLHQALTKAGFPCRPIDCHQGTPPPLVENRPPRLLDLKA